MKALRRPSRRVAVAILLLCLCLAVPAARQVAAGVDAAPMIEVQVRSGVVIQVTGSRFTPGGSVLVEAGNAETGSIIALVNTQAVGDGTISANVRAPKAPCADSVVVRAFDLTNHARSNEARVSLQSCVIPPHSDFFATATEESYATYQLPGDGDLWPSCWADDDNVYAANGDGTAFTGAASRFDMAVSRIAGMPPHLSGTTVATEIGTNWSGADYNRKPTGMACVNDTLYLAFQNLNRQTFDDAPAASIAKSTDHGRTWTWNAAAPMFGDPKNPDGPLAYKFTTVFFLDYGKNNVNAADGYVYAYGFDNNWRAQQKLFLARVPNTAIQTRTRWRFFTGTDTHGNPLWSNDITKKAPVLEDERLLAPRTFGNYCCSNNPVLGQGGVVYDAPLHRYIFTSWSYATHQFYEAPRPWGPWSLFLSKDFGPLQLAHNRGQYGTSIPSKYVSPDGGTLYLQSNVCCQGDSYTFSLRKLYVQPYAPAAPTNPKNDADNLAVTGGGTTAISRSTHFGKLCGRNCADLLNNGVTTESEDDFDQEAQSTDWWGYTWGRPYNMNKVVYTTGKIAADGGWYRGGLRVQVRRLVTWTDVSDLQVTPRYPDNSATGTNRTYTFTFKATSGDGVRIIGSPGGPSHFTSIAELAVYYER